MPLCPRCHEDLPLSAFFWRKDRKRPGQCKQCELRRERELNQVLKADAMAAYGGPKCALCGSTEQLQIDHITGGGTVHRIATFGADRSGRIFWHWLKKKGYPPGYRVLCRSCNSGWKKTRAFT